MIARHGRKFTLAVVGITLLTGVTVLAIWRQVDVGYVNAFAGALTGIILSFSAANASVEWRHAGSLQARQNTEPSRFDDER